MQHPDPLIDHNWRAALVSFIDKVHAGLTDTAPSLETLYMAVHTADRFLGTPDGGQVRADQMMVLGAACLLTASKYEDTVRVKLSELQKWGRWDEELSFEAVTSMEFKIARALGYRFSAPTCQSFVHHFLEASRQGDEDMQLAHQQNGWFDLLPDPKANAAAHEGVAVTLAWALRATLPDWRMLRHRPSLVTATALLLGRKRHLAHLHWGLGPAAAGLWTARLRQTTGYEVADLYSCLYDMEAILQERQMAASA